MTIHRLAYLLRLRNVQRGLETRSKIIDNLDSEEWKTPLNISKEVEVTASTIRYHLHNMEREDIVEREPRGNGWRFAPMHQSELTEFISKKSKKK